jgi:hypothetical protein
MAVYVALLPNAIPPNLLEDAERTLSYDDQTAGEQTVHFEYTVSDGGVLTVWKITPEGPGTPEVRYGPAAWESVQGTPRRSRL